ncbi:MAG: hypothetical protein ACP5N2_01100 [Candidatus Nanoarchaeia archaeon]
MSLYQCDNCGCMENTALSKGGDFGFMDFFQSDPEIIKQYKIKLGLTEDTPFGHYCSACSPSGDGQWHGKFERVYLPKGEFETGPNGNLRNKKTLDEDVRKFALEISSK